MNGIVFLKATHAINGRQPLRLGAEITGVQFPSQLLICNMYITPNIDLTWAVNAHKAV